MPVHDARTIGFTKICIVVYTLRSDLDILSCDHFECSLQHTICVISGWLGISLEIVKALLRL